MFSIMINKHNSNIEFKKMVDRKIIILTNNDFIVKKVKYKVNLYNRYTGAIIKYKKRGE